MSEMIDKVAIAIHCAGWSLVPDEWPDDVSNEMRDLLVSQARAAIASLREAMTPRLGDVIMAPRHGGDGCDESIFDVWSGKEFGDDQLTSAHEALLTYEEFNDRWKEMIDEVLK